ncbi:MAG TPA: serine hydrolase [Candidatus Dormibacteraeota bacterium]|nr:serine hydrolase [Candidatus Dormibacteraeota bacterium]
MRWLACLILGYCATCAAAPDPRLTAAVPGIETLIRTSGAEVAVAFRTFDGRSEWLRNADDSFHAASTMKVPVLIELYRQVRAGQVRLDDTLLIKNEFRSLADGSLYALSPEDDSEQDLYRAAGQTRTLAQLDELMITVSSNLATNLLMQKLGVDNIRAAVQALGADGMHVLRGVEDGKAFERGMNNTTTARALLILMRAIAEGRAVDAHSSRAMVAVLERQTFNDRIPAGLPPGTRVAHKTGEITKIQHDAAIVYAPRPFVLVVLTRGIEDPKQSATLTAEITRQLYKATQTEGK